MLFQANFGHATERKEWIRWSGVLAAIRPKIIAVRTPLLQKDRFRTDATSLEVPNS
jgi:hypothetical protein